MDQIGTKDLVVDERNGKKGEKCVGPSGQCAIECSTRRKKRRKAQRTTPEIGTKLAVGRRERIS